MAKLLPDISVLNNLFIYNPDNGEIRNRISRANNRLKAGDISGSRNKAGYIYIKIDGELFAAHRIAWKMYYGEEPPESIDHKDTIRWNNAILNIRESDGTGQQANQKKPSNNTTGNKNIYRKAGKIFAGFTINGKQTSKSFPDTDEGLLLAIEWRNNKGVELFGEFYNKGE
jgi:hypothetical protein